MSHTPSVSARAGFTLVEVLVAILLLTIVLLALEGSAAATVRELADGQREIVATRFAERQRERAFASACTTSVSVKVVVA